MNREAVVIVGASIGGVRTAQALRGANYTGRIIVVTDEIREPYDKPPLSKAFLAGTATVDKISLLSHAAAEELGIELLLGWRATRVDLACNEVEFESGKRLTFGHLVIATGARALPSPWGQPDGVQVLRTLDDSLRLRAELEYGGRLVVVGGGFIGAEIAATAISMGLTVTIVDPNSVPMQRVLGTEIGEAFKRLHESNGVTTFFGVGVQGITGHRGHFRVGLTNGHVLAADYLVFGIGAVPNDQWLASSGLRTANGVVCDEYLRAVEASNVFAVGDVCRWLNPRYGRATRVEHWTNAVDQAAAVAHNISQPSDLIAYGPVEYVWSDQYDWKIRIVGDTSLGDGGRVEVIGDDHADRFAALYRPNGHALGGIVTVNWPRALIMGRKALAERTPYRVVKDTLGQLAEPNA
ncbi:NAD(P)/FAD-dependent oxidoreductase [Mycobacterium kansasii]|uniref:NAD(P)/FAD-dependent oxidoreductase n=2 Tax=Mycobacterium kansasii TaxID=1768 RepID=UPI000CDD970B|nr:FAD/NAD(P)-binding oxidoreductase [Mycobacterium kansasii]POX88859.1 FAD-dependent oxidoreductase [Mycobacterium kansasii]POY24113.1 FAD-dependent oxidoreductase [Mycobacterium kansasii]